MDLRWFKHLSTAHDDTALAALLDEMGYEGYGLYWMLLEYFAAAMKKDCESVPEITHTVIQRGEICRCSSRKFARFGAICSKLRLICAETAPDLRRNCSRRATKQLRICIPKLLKYRDEYSKKSGQTPDKLRRDSGQTPAQETETETETDSKKSTLCIDNIQSQEQTRARVAESPHTPSPPLNGNGNSHPNGARKPVLATLPDWEKICIAARKGGMSYDPSPQSIASRRFRLLTLPERIAAIEGIHKRIACGEYDPSQPAFTHTLENYLTRKIWQQAVRPQIRGPAKRRVTSALERLAAKGATAND